MFNKQGYSVSDVRITILENWKTKKFIARGCSPDQTINVKPLMDHAHFLEVSSGKVDDPKDETSRTCCCQPDPLLGESLVANALCRLCSLHLEVGSLQFNWKRTGLGDLMGGIVNMLE